MFPCFKISASSQLLLVKIEPKYLIESAYKIGNDNSGGNNALYYFRVKATQKDLVALKFESISLLY